MSFSHVYGVAGVCEGVSGAEHVTCPASGRPDQHTHTVTLNVICSRSPPPTLTVRMLCFPEVSQPLGDAGRTDFMNSCQMLDRGVLRNELGLGEADGSISKALAPFSLLSHYVYVIW